MTKTIKVLLADDHAIMRMGLSSLMETARDIAVVGEADDGESAVRKSLKLQPDVVIMDLMMPVMDGVEATAEIRRRLPGTKVLILTTFGTADGIAHALNAGASGALMKNVEYSKLLDAIRRIDRGERIVSPEIEAHIAEHPPLPGLTPRQREILESITKGLTNADIAKQLGIRIDSVQEHISAILLKLGASTRSEAVAIVLRKHLLKV